MCCNKLIDRIFALALVATLLAACGGGGSAAAPESVTGPPPVIDLPAAPAVKNELRVYVDAGPADTGYNVNRLYADVTICQPGSTTHCQTIDHVLVDTGSTGLRLLSSVMAPGLNLSRVSTTRGSPLLNCAQFLDLSFAWGPVVTADIVLGGMKADGVPIQVIADTDPRFSSPPAACSVGGTAITTAKILGANGVLGLGLSKEDCGAGCETITNNGFYYTCADDSCASIIGVKTNTDKQVKHPVPLFVTDNNGVQIALPAVTTSIGVPTLDGTLTFGIGTQSSAFVTVLTTNSSVYFTTVLTGQNLPDFSRSFIDSGSNGLFFDSAIPTCTGTTVSDFYCPSMRLDWSARLVGANGVLSPTLLFSVDNATQLFASRTNAELNHVFPTLAGNLPGHPTAFDWGLPFFYGRRVFFGIEGQPSSLGNGPFYAF
ncbi:MAG: DUF3443 family protein [Rhodoferax sp.]